MKYNVNVAVVNLVYNKSNLVGKDGFGYLVPSMDKEGILGVINVKGVKGVKVIIK